MGCFGNYFFLVGFNDCVSGLKWVYMYKDKLGISSIIVSGEFGGGNLSFVIIFKVK